MADMTFEDIDIIAELANAHGGNRSRAIEMISGVSQSVDAAKIQVFTANDLAVESHDDYALYEELALTTDEIREIIRTAHENEIYLFADVLGLEGLEKISTMDVDGYKIHSSDLANHQLIEEVGRLDKPTLISAGGTTSVEIRATLSTFETISDESLGLIYGFQNYPSSLEDANLNRLKRFCDEFGDKYFVGYASHVDGGTDIAKQLPGWAVAAGADFVEVHVTLDRSEEGIDYYSSIEPEQFETMAANVQAVQTALGEYSIQMTEKEREYRNNHKKCVVATRDIDTGDKITKTAIAMKRPQKNTEHKFKEIDRVIGKTAAKPIRKDQPVSTTDLEYTVAAVLACRAESTRLYGKPLQLVGDKSILGHVVTQLQGVDSIDEIVLAIADAPSKNSFIDMAKKHDLEFVIGDEVDVLGRVVKASQKVGADLVVRAMTENPFLYGDIISKQIETAIQDNSDLTVPRKLPVGTFTEVISSHALKKSHELGEDKHKSELVTSFITEHPQSFKIIGVYPPKPVRRPDIRLTVDNPCDLILMRQLWNFLSNLEQPYNISKLIDHYDAKQLESINNHKPNGETEEVIKRSWHIYGQSDKKLHRIYEQE